METIVQRHDRYVVVEKIAGPEGEIVEQTRPAAAAGRLTRGYVPAAPMIEGTPGTPFEGEVLIRRRRWSSDESGFAVIDADRDGDELVLVGTIAHLEERERVRIAGVWQDDRRFGMQVKVATARAARPGGRRRAAAYLKRVKHVGPGRAERLLAALRRRRARGRSTATRTPRSAPPGSTRGAPTRRSGRGTGCGRAARCTCCSPRTGSPGSSRASRSHYGDRAHHIVRERPYELTSVFGVGFHTADTIARAGGVPRRLPGTRTRRRDPRAGRGGEGRLDVPAGRGARGEARARCSAPAPPAELLREMDADGELVLDVDAAGAVWAYRPPTAALEAELAQQSASWRAGRPADSGPGPPRCARRRPRPRARAGGRGPRRVRVAPLDRHRRPRHRQDRDDPADLRRRRRRSGGRSLLVAPTGRAARRMAESTGVEASTIHSALGWIPGQGPTVDELGVDLLIVDETSMANLELLVTLLRAVGGRTHVVLVGDADQLAPVGAGKPFAELVEAQGGAGRGAHAHLPPGGRAA